LRQALEVICERVCMGQLARTHPADARSATHDGPMVP
jgi:hypothetical protein